MGKIFKLLGAWLAVFFVCVVAFGCCHGSKYYAPRVENYKQDLVKSVAMLEVNGKVRKHGKLVGVSAVASAFAVDTSHLITAAHFCIPVQKGIEEHKLNNNIKMDYLNNNDDFVSLDGLKIVAVDKRLDICLLEKRHHGLIPVPLASPRDIKRGDKVSIIGAPLGVFPIKTDGEVAIPFVEKDRGGDMVGGRMIVTAPAAPGNSGGPAFNENGEVVGIVMAGPSNYDHIIVLTPSWMMILFLDENLK